MLGILQADESKRRVYRYTLWWLAEWVGIDLLHPRCDGSSLVKALENKVHNVPQLCGAFEKLKLDDVLEGEVDRRWAPDEENWG